MAVKNKRLAGERHQLADALDVGDETHVEHAIGLVDDEELDAAEQKPAALVMVEQAARRRDQHIDAAHQLGILVVERHAADDQRDVELIVVGAVFDEAFFDLRRKLAGRLEDQRARHARSRPTGFQHGQHRQHEGRGLAGAGLGDAQHVAPGEHVGDGLILNGGRSFVTSRRNGSEYFFGQAEMGKRHKPSYWTACDGENRTGGGRRAAEFASVAPEHRVEWPKVNL